MTTKTDARGAVVDWKQVELATEVPRTYLVKDKYGREFFKMYKPSEAHDIFKSRGWRGQIISTLDKTRAGRKT